MEVSFLDYDKDEVKELLSDQHSAFLDYNNGSQIAFLPTKNIDTYCQNFIEFFNKQIKTVEHNSAAKSMAAEFKENINKFRTVPQFPTTTQSSLVFFNPKRGLEVAVDVNSAFPTASNPFFKEDLCEKNLIELLTNDSLSTELVLFCIEQYESKLSFFQEDMGKLFLSEIDFMLRFWKNDNYRTTPAVSIFKQN